MSQTIADIVQELKTKSIRELLNGVSINRECDIPYIAGCSNDMKTVYIDKGVPRTVLDRNGVKRSIDVFLAIHEIVETTILKALGVDYMVGHNIATEFEKKAVERAGINWQEYDLLMRAEDERTEAKDPVDAPSDLYLKPYVDSGDDKHLEMIMDGKKIAKELIRLAKSLVSIDINDLQKGDRVYLIVTPTRTYGRETPSGREVKQVVQVLEKGGGSGSIVYYRVRNKSGKFGELTIHTGTPDSLLLDKRRYDVLKLVKIEEFEMKNGDKITYYDDSIPNGVSFDVVQKVSGNKVITKKGETYDKDELNWDGLKWTNKWPR